MDNEERIETFRGEFSFLSNFTTIEKPLEYQGNAYSSVEHFYIAMKTLDKGKRVEVSQHPAKGLKAFGQQLELREDWTDVLRLNVMLYATCWKYNRHNPKLRAKLKATGGKYIQEGNWWGDAFFGFCFKTEQGHNHLGNILMKVREEIITEDKISAQ